MKSPRRCALALLLGPAMVFVALAGLAVWQSLAPDGRGIVAFNAAASFLVMGMVVAASADRIAVRAASSPGAGILYGLCVLAAGGATSSFLWLVAIEDCTIASCMMGPFVVICFFGWPFAVVGGLLFSGSLRESPDDERPGPHQDPGP